MENVFMLQKVGKLLLIFYHHLKVCWVFSVIWHMVPFASLIVWFNLASKLSEFWVWFPQQPVLTAISVGQFMNW